MQQGTPDTSRATQSRDDVEAAMDLLSGPVMFRFLVTHEPVDASFVQCVRDVVVDGLERGHCR